MSTTDHLLPTQLDPTEAVPVAPAVSPDRSDLADLPDPAERPPAPAPAGSTDRVSGIGTLDVLLVAGWMGLVFGLAEAGYFAFMWFGLGTVPPSGVRLFWMCPAMQAATFLMLALPLVLIVVGTRKPISQATVVCWLAFVGTTGLAYLVPGVHPAARLLVAGGVAVQAWRYGSAHGTKIVRISRRTVLWLLLVTFAVAVAVEGSRWVSAQRTLAALPAAERRAPNVLLIVLDTVSAEAVGLGVAEPAGGGTANTPNLNGLAEEGVVFRQAVAPAPWTLPSHASIFTGRHTSELSCGWSTVLDDTYPTIAERLKEAGYSTAGFVANTRFCRAETGLARGFIHYDDYAITPGRFLLCTELGRRMADVTWIFSDKEQVDRRSADDITGAFVRWLDRSGTDDASRPFFAFLNFFDAHDPYVPPPEFASAPCRTETQEEIIREWWYLEKARLNADEVEFARRNYLDCITYIDDRLGRLFGQLKQRGVLDNTLLIVTSDHGEHFGDHELFGHGNSLYQPAIQVPLILRYPGRIPAGARCDQAIGLRELPATIMEFVGSEPAGSEPAGSKAQRDRSFPGESLSRFWTDPENDAQRPATGVFSSIALPAVFPPCHGRSPTFLGPMTSLVVGDYKYVRAGEHHEELYDIRRDPGEARNLADEPRFEAKMKRMRSAIESALP